MTRVFYLPSFLKQLRSLRGKEAATVKETLVRFQSFIQTGEKAEGLGFKNLTEDKFEIRTDLRQRIIMKKIGHDYYLALYGDHAAIERFLKRH